jgi:hypothetical protein
MTTISGMVYNDTGAPAPDRILRAYARDSGVLLAKCRTGNGLTIGDDNFQKVVHLLPLENNIIDYSFSVNQHVALNGNAILASGGAFGNDCLTINGANDYLSITNPNPISLDAFDFTVELWVKTSTTVLDAGIISIDGVPEEDYESFVITTDGVFASTTGTSWAIINQSVGVINDGNWHHVAVTRQGPALRTFCDGTLVATSTTLGDSSLYASGGLTVIGKKSFILTEPTAYQINGVRVTKGVARYTESFSPLAEMYPLQIRAPVGSYTLALGEYTQECNVVCLDDSEGTTYNDLIYRVIPG